MTLLQLAPLLPLKRIAAIRSSNVDKVVEDNEIPIRLCNYVDVYYNDQIHPALEFAAGSAKQSEIDRFGLRPGDVLITKDSETPDDIAVPALVVQGADDLVCGYHLALLRPNPSRLNGKFLFYALKSRSLQAAFSVLAQGITRFGLTLSGIGSVAIPLPDLPTQKAIADFLDRETARIDQLIEKKQRMVEVLGEKRAAAITRSVCGDHRSECLEGRDQGAAEGGIRVTKYQLPPLLPLKRLAAIHSSNVDKVIENDEIPIRLCNYVDVYHNDQIHPALEFSSGSAKQSEIDRFGLRPGDVLITKDSETPNDIAVPALVIQSTDDLVCGYHLALLRPNPSRLSGTFLFYALKSRSTQAAFSILAHGITRFGLTLNGIGSVPVPLPDLPTQEAIIDFLDGETASIDALITKIRKTIDRLREFRSALITAAVTGQIDVSTWGKQGTTDHRLDRIEEATSA